MVCLHNECSKTMISQPPDRKSFELLTMFKNCAFVPQRVSIDVYVCDVYVLCDVCVYLEIRWRFMKNTVFNVFSPHTDLYNSSTFYV